MKKGFSLAEALIAMTIIGIVAAITIPALNNVRPDKDKTFYNKALSSVQGAMAKAMQLPVANKRYNYWEDTTFTNNNGQSVEVTTSLYWADDSIEDSAFCKAIADFLNTSGAINCANTSSYENPNFVTTDGVRYWGLEGKFSKTDAIAGNGRIIYVDRKLTDGEVARLEKTRDSYHKKPGLKITLYYDGGAETGTTSEFDYENELVKTSINLSK